jgi:archaellum biogenesis ATPase FlaH
MELKKTNRSSARIRVALQGTSGSGKSYSSLLLAYGLCKDWKKIAVIDSEHQSSTLYSHLGEYNVLNL